MAILHSWDLTPLEAINVQKKLANQIELTSFNQPVRYIAGLDCAFGSAKTHCYAVCVLWDMQEKKIIEEHSASALLSFPYVPGLLSFREAPAMLEAYSKLSRIPDVVFIDGHGIAHPRGLGIAAHLGLWIGKPTIGVGKSRLVGTYDEPDLHAGCFSDLTYRNKLIGQVVRTRDKVRPLFISPGNLMDIESATRIVLQACQGYRLPEPTRWADKLVGKVARQED